MKKVFKYCFTVSLLTIAGLFNTINIKQAHAVYDPLSVPNNKIGIHVLFPDELILAKDLVNSNGGDWGYVTIPIQAGDRDLKKWQRFMDEAKKHHVIPIVRLATAGDYFKKTTWTKPEDSDIVDFANFLNSLEWPVKNRYIIIFNEVNRADEWEGESNPAEYAQLLSYATVVFKSKSPDFFIISAGLDNASETNGATYNQFDFMHLMNQEIPGIFNQIDAVSSHSYPNPAFSQPPTVLTKRSISSFLYELSEIGKYTNKKLPVLITETGWDQTLFSHRLIGDFFKQALNETWNHPSIIAITPFLLKGGNSPFEKFSFVKGNGEKNEIFKTFESLPKTKGEPQLYEEKEILGISQMHSTLPVKDFSKKYQDQRGKKLKTFIRWVFRSLGMI